MFRQQIVNKHRDRLSGNVAIALPLSWQVIGFLLASGVAIALIFLSLASYARVEVASGAIAPDVGIAPVLPTRSGVVIELSVMDGQLVSAGTQLATIRAEEDGITAQAPGAIVEAAIERQDASLKIQASASVAAAQAQTAQLAA